MWLPFTDLCQYHSKLCGPLFPPHHQLQIWFTSITVIQLGLKCSEKCEMSWHQTKNQRRSLQWWKNDSSYKILSLLLSASCNFTLLHMLAHPLSGGPPILGHSLMVRNTLPDSLISLLLSQALCRPTSLFFSGLCNTNHTSKTQLRGPYLPPVLSIHMLSMPGPLLLPLHHCVCNAFFWASSAVPPLFLWTSVTHSLPSYPMPVTPSPRLPIYTNPLAPASH